MKSVTAPDMLHRGWQGTEARTLGFCPQCLRSSKQQLRSLGDSERDAFAKTSVTPSPLKHAKPLCWKTSTSDMFQQYRGAWREDGEHSGGPRPSLCCYTWNWITFSVERHRYMRSLPWNWKAHLWSWEMGSSTSSMAYCFVTFRMICGVAAASQGWYSSLRGAEQAGHVPNTRRDGGLPGEAG